ncbi:dnaJ homolog subfamily C member 24 isoform X4 [Lepidochelys kempii]|uniref:dnaJ homolog subfamily C member 24 isoform X4 n=1 Tax=Lepidochelys kempii TaxID=8472 RepID=UPI003C6F49B9
MKARAGLERSHFLVSHIMAFEHIPRKDWYKILGAEPSESLTELKQKYQKLVLLYHPDKQSADVPAGEVEERVQRFIEIDQAWKILGNEETKKEYDLQRRGRRKSSGWLHKISAHPRIPYAHSQFTSHHATDLITN